MARKSLPFAAHIGIEFLAGLALAVSPFLFDFDGGVTIVSIALGLGTMTVALSTRIGGRAVSLHQAWDRALLVLFAVAAVVSAIVDFGPEVAIFGGAAVIEGTLLTLTRYLPEPLG